MRTNRLLPYLFAVLLAVVLSAGTGCRSEHDRHADVARRGAEVMPFDLEKTEHHFENRPEGGRQQVVAKDTTDAEQVRLIQEHLEAEAERFSRGDYSDPARIHGAAMPGLAELAQGADRVRVLYTRLPNGGQIDYTSEDPVLVEAIHRWFAAQRSDHGAHADGH